MSNSAEIQTSNFLSINHLCLFLCLFTFIHIQLYENTQQMRLKKRK